MVKRNPCKFDSVGSIPTGGHINIVVLPRGKAPDFGSGNRWFESIYGSTRGRDWFDWNKNLPWGDCRTGFRLPPAP